MLETLLGIFGSALLGVVGWAFALNTKVAVLEQKEQGLRELIEQRFDGVDRRLERIEASMNGQLKK